jgi:hypothetical protein
MSAVNNTPQNKNFLSPLNFKFSIKRAPNLNFFIQKANIPSIRIPSFEIPTIFNPIPTPYTHMEYGDFDITFKVDEDFQNYLEIHNWIRALGFPEQFEERTAISKNPDYSGEGLYSDLSLIILNSAKKPNYEFTFRSAFPTDLSSVEFDTSDDDVDYVTASASFKYMLFDIVKIT